MGVVQNTCHPQPDYLRVCPTTDNRRSAPGHVRVYPEPSRAGDTCMRCSSELRVLVGTRNWAQSRPLQGGHGQVKTWWQHSVDYHADTSAGQMHRQQPRWMRRSQRRKRACMQPDLREHSQQKYKRNTCVENNKQEFQQHKRANRKHVRMVVCGGRGMGIAPKGRSCLEKGFSTETGMR